MEENNVTNNNEMVDEEIVAFNSDKEQTEEQKTSTAGLVLGILSIVFGILIAIVGLVLGIIGLVISFVKRDTCKVKACIILNIVGIVISLANMILGAVLVSGL